MVCVPSHRSWLDPINNGLRIFALTAKRVSKPSWLAPKHPLSKG